MPEIKTKTKTQETAENYGKQKLEGIINYLENNNLHNTAPYLQFKQILYSLDSKYQQSAQ